MRNGFIYLSFAVVFAAAAIAVIASSNQIKPSNDLEQPDTSPLEFWSDGNAELTGYAIEQVRYGEVRNGKAVMIFVKENFIDKEQVKDESGTKPSSPVLKLNFYKEFQTGIYKYSMMNSVFNLFEEGETGTAIKLTSSSQDWCGHSFIQLNKRSKNKFSLKRYTYFEKTADQEKSVTPQWLEDELWNQIRINPKRLPTGELTIFPSGFFMHLKLLDAEAVTAKASLSTTDFQGKEAMVYNIDIPDQQRTKQIFFSKKPPYEIYGWEEHFPEYGEMMTNRGRAIRSFRLPYWELRSNSMNHWHDSLFVEIPF